MSDPQDCYLCAKYGEPTPAKWLWTGANGYTWPLCQTAFDVWTEQAVEAPWLAPVRYRAAPSATG